jgi:hypothetical protein
MELSQNHFLSKGENLTTDQAAIVQLPLFPEALLPPKTGLKPPSLHTYWLHAHALPPGASDSPTILRCLDLLGPLDWDGVPERNLQRNWGQSTIPYTALIAAELIKLNESLLSTFTFGTNRRFFGTSFQRGEQGSTCLSSFLCSAKTVLLLTSIKATHSISFMG